MWERLTVDVGERLFMFVDQPLTGGLIEDMGKD